MANRDSTDVQALQPDTFAIVGSFGMNGTSAPSTSSVKGKGFSTTVAYDDTNKIYTVTLDDKWTDCISFQATVQLNAVDTTNKITAQPYEVSVSSRTVKIRIVNSATGAAATPVSSNANNRVNFTVWVRNQ